VSIATADLHEAINTAWDASSLNTLFQNLWSGYETEFPVLHDQEASPGQPFPYVIMEQTSTNVVTRMSTSVGKREIRDIECTFNVQARAISGDSRTAKEIASYLAEEIMKVFGGHPTSAPSGTITLNSGNHLITQYLNDYGVRTGDDEYQWTIEYRFRLDVPIR